MELHHIQTVLRVMNLTTSCGMTWCAARFDIAESYTLKDLGGEAEIRFYLVPDDSALLGGEGVITA
jgi:hypothetical protein